MGVNIQPPLHQAIENGDIELVKDLLEQGRDIYLQNELGMNSLHLAVDKGHYEIVKLLTGNEPCINSKCGPSKDPQTCYAGYTPLHFSSKNGDEEITKLLLLNDALPIIQETKSGNTPLHFATLKRATNIVRLFLENEYSKNFINVQNDSKECALHIAAASGYEDVIADLLESEADTKLRDVHGNTPLHLACDNGNGSVVHQLLTHSNEELNSQNKSWCTPLHYAIRKKDQDLTTTLLEFKANTLLTDQHGNTPLHYACESNHPENVDLLISHGSLVNARNLQEKTPLHVAVDVYSVYLLTLNKNETTYNESFDENNETIMNLLRENGASLYASDKLGNTPFHYAALYKNSLYVNLFLDWDSDIVDYINCERKTALIIASENKSIDSVLNTAPVESDIQDRNTKVMELLLQYKANPGLCDKYGNTPLHYSCINNKPEDVQLFLEHGCSVDIKNNEGKTPLLISAQIKSSKLVKPLSEENVKEDFHVQNNSIINKLFSQGADLNLPDDCGNSPLHYSCVNNNYERVQLLLKHGCLVNSRNNKGETALQIATKYMPAKVDKSLNANRQDLSENTQILNILLENGADPNVADEFGNTPLHYACLSNNYERVQMFLKYNTNVDFQNNERKTALSIAAEYLPIIYGEATLRKDLQSKSQAENNQIVRKLLKSGAGVNIIDELGNTPLHYACLNNKLEQVNVFLIRGCNVNVQNNAKKTPLLIASDYGLIESRALLLERSAKDFLKQRNLEIVELLLRFEADTVCCDEFKNTPLHFACINNNYAQIDVILNNGGDVNQVNKNGKTALHMATQNLSLENNNCKEFQSNNMLIMMRLLDCKANVELFDKLRNTPLHYACMNNNFEQVKLLLKFGSNVHFKNINGNTCLQITIIHVSSDSLQNSDFKIENVEIVKALLEYGADPNSVDEFNNTLLHYSCINNNLDCVKLLIDNGCEINSKNLEGKTALNLLIETQSSDSTSVSSGPSESSNKQTIEEFLLDNDANANISDNLENTPLHYACVNNNYEQVKLLQKKHVIVDSMNIYGETPLITATKQTIPDSLETAERRLAIVNCLYENFERGFDRSNADMDKNQYFDLSDILGNTFLHYACSNSHLECADVYKNICQIDARNIERKTPLILATEMCSTLRISNYVSQKGNKLDIQSRYTEIVNILITEGANAQLFDNLGNTALHYSCFNNILDNVKSLVARSKIDEANYEQKTALHIATQKCWLNFDISSEGKTDNFETNHQIVDLLIQSGADIDLHDGLGNTALHYACINNNFDNVKKLIMVNNDADINTENNEGKTALHIATQKPWLEFGLSSEEKTRNFQTNKEIVELLVKSEADVNLCDKFGNTALHYAFINNDLEYLQLFVTHDCKVNSRNKEGKTALHFLAENYALHLKNGNKGFQTIKTLFLKLLFTYGANPNLSDIFGNTPLHYACINNNFDHAQLFVKYGCSVNHQNRDRKSALIITAENTVTKIVDSLNKEIPESEFYKENMKIIDFLLKSGANAKLFDKHENTALHYAIINNNIEQVRHLLNHGCDINHQNGYKKSPLIIATERTPAVLVESLAHKNPADDVYGKQKQILDLLLKSGANTDLYDNHGNTALHYACINDNIEQVRCFLKYGCDDNFRNENNKQALDIATDNNSNDIVDLFMIKNECICEL